MSELTQLGSVKGHLANPKGSGPFPALIVIQVWWGLDRAKIRTQRPS
jgi:dienelactone hydrolase